MARTARADIFDPQEVSVFHCINRCVRRCFLCGRDPVTDADYRHRKRWVEQRLELLAGCFGIDVLAFAILENHFHVILRNRPDLVRLWTDQEVARRWLMLCPRRRKPDRSPETPNDSEIAMIVNDPKRLQQIRSRLSDISWFMRMISEPIARRANAEENLTGRFWQGRFKAIKLCDEAALLACSIYVDLNPIRAGIASTAESAEHTSAKLRIDELRGQQPASWLDPLEIIETEQPGPQPAPSGSKRCSDKGYVPIQLEDYLTLLDWTGRRAVQDKSGAVPSQLAPILVRLGIEPNHWLQLSTRFERFFFRVAGKPPVLADEATRRGRRWFQAPGGALLQAAAA